MHLRSTRFASAVVVLYVRCWARVKASPAMMTPEQRRVAKAKKDKLAREVKSAAEAEAANARAVKAADKQV